MIALTDEQVGRFNTLLSAVSLLMILLTMGTFFTLDGLDMSATAGCVQNIFGLWICLFITCMYTREQSYSSSGRWFVSYTAVLIPFFTLEFFRRIPTESSTYFLATGYGTMFLNLIAIYAFWFYVRSHSRKGRFLSRMNISVTAVFLLGMLLIAYGLVTGDIIDFDNGLVTGRLYQAAWIAPIVLILAMITTILMACESKTYKAAMLLFCIVPLMFVFITVFNSKFSFTEFAYIVSVMIVLGYHYQNRGKTIRRQKADLTASKLNPHFMFNALTSIINIEGNPQETKDALYDFTTYLRANIDTIGSDRPIPFSKEIEIVQSFVDLQKLRFKNSFEVVYDIRTEDFSIPALSVEILVENSIKHGLLPNGGKGTVTVSSIRTAAGVVVTVKDDGAGFDTSALNTAAPHGHFGISGLRERLVEISQGRLEIESEPGRGTVSTIYLPIPKK